jgi:competence protein ComEC
MKVGKPITIYPLFWLAVAAGAGIMLGRYEPQDFRLLAVGGVLLLVLALWWKGWISRLALIGATLMIFQFYAQVREHGLPATHLKHLIGQRGRSGEMVCRVLDLPILKTTGNGESRMEFTGEVESLADLNGLKNSSGKVRVIVRQPGVLTLVPGQTVAIQGFWQRPDRTVNPGEFDYRAYLENKRIYYILKCQGDSVQEVRPSRDPFTLTAFHLREHMLSVLKLGLEDDPQISGLMAGMLFGYKEGITEEVEEAFRATGTLHLFAVSGQNVGVILGMLLVILQLSGLIRWRWAWLMLPILLLFCLATGMQSSATRAFLMTALIVFAWAIYRPTNLFNVLGAAALFLWVIDPAELFDVGFQLSFFVVLGMALGTEPLLSWLYQWGKPDPWIPRRLIPQWRLSIDKTYFLFCGVVATSLCAWLASQALIYYYFNLFAPVTLLANIVVMPLAALILTASVLSVAGSFVTTGCSVLLNQVNWLALKCLILIVECLATLPGGHFYVAQPGSAIPRDEWRMTIFQSQQATPLFIQSGGSAYLLDTGSTYVWKSSLNRYRQQLGINQLDGIILTQGSVDHMAAARLVMEQIPAAFWAEGGYSSKSRVFREWLREMESKQIPKQFWRQGDHLELPGGVSVEVLWPSGNRLSELQQDQGLVLRFIKKEQALIYAGDISESVEKQLVASGRNLQAQVLIQGEHGSEKNLSRVWLEAVRPQWLIRPQPGFRPDRELGWEKAEELRQSGVTLFQMEKSGALQFRVQADGGSDLRAWFSPEKSFK